MLYKNAIIYLKIPKNTLKTLKLLIYIIENTKLILKLIILLFTFIIF